ncbi:hypothetical protein MSAN_02481100 [Mycena sanguinolenta]|uniref:Uncharacterized protein n=1 Tax=Mycena sanguinolenta TaxID=230812 RepID=A0A8H6WRP8_9AGAR|nr:hypothetical protein MSAN_02481100 [Mycena sanguinolenta]
MGRRIHLSLVRSLFTLALALVLALPPSLPPTAFAVDSAPPASLPSRFSLPYIAVLPPLPCPQTQEDQEIQVGAEQRITLQCDLARLCLVTAYLYLLRHRRALRAPLLPVAASAIDLVVADFLGPFTHAHARERELHGTPGVFVSAHPSHFDSWPGFVSLSYFDLMATDFCTSTPPTSAFLSKLLPPTLIPTSATAKGGEESEETRRKRGRGRCVGKRSRPRAVAAWRGGGGVLCRMRASGRRRVNSSAASFTRVLALFSSALLSSSSTRSPALPFDAPSSPCALRQGTGTEGGRVWVGGTEEDVEDEAARRSQAVRDGRRTLRVEGRTWSRDFGMESTTWLLRHD